MAEPGAAGAPGKDGDCISGVAADATAGDCAELGSGCAAGEIAPADCAGCTAAGALDDAGSFVVFPADVAACGDDGGLVVSCVADVVFVGPAGAGRTGKTGCVASVVSVAETAGPAGISMVTTDGPEAACVAVSSEGTDATKTAELRTTTKMIRTRIRLNTLQKPHQWNRECYSG